MTAGYKLDMTTMVTYHDALRRDLEPIARMTARSEGWDLFKRFLHAHHVAEDEALWPVVRGALRGHSADVALLDDMEAEHARLGPLLEAVDDALDRGDTAPRARADLAARLREHLVHEEDSALPVIDRVLDEEQWMQFGEAAAQKVGPDMPTFLPWLLDGRDVENADALLAHLPEPTQQAYRHEWQPSYAATDRWAT
jgi:hypothetical protein